MESLNLSLHRTALMSSTFCASRLVAVKNPRIRNVRSKFRAKSSTSSACCSRRGCGYPGVKYQFGCKEQRIPSDRREVARGTLTIVKNSREVVCLATEAERAAAADDCVGWLKEQRFPDQVGEVALSVPADFFVTGLDVNNQPVVSGPAGELKERVAALEVYEELSSGFSEKDPQNVLPSEITGSSAGTLYLVDIHPLCYEGKRPRPRAILKWMKLLFNQVTRENPVIAVMDGEKGNDYRRHLLPGYKAKRNKYKPLTGVRGPYYKGDEMDLREAFPLIQNFLIQCNVPVLKVEDAEADDVIATLMHQAVSKGMRVVVASPDMDFRQLLSENVNMLLPLPEFGRWSFYTLEQYVAQNSCDPGLDLGLRCILGDSSDNVPGLPELAPGFGRKTALKLMKKHGSLESLLVAAKTRTVGRPYIQEALTQHADVLHRNLQVLKLRRDLAITLKEEWCRRRDRSSELQAFQRLEKNLLRTTVS